ncbi:predicted protein [Streptomyces sp. AA4]|nr:predicted protein [Streptomyces sp. AA4]
MTDARREIGGTHPPARTGVFCPTPATAIPRRSPAKRARRLSPSAERERFALFEGKAAAHRGGLPAAGSGRATTTVRGEQAR